MPSDTRILIVDDHEDTLYALESALAPLGYRLGRATSGDEALKQVLRGQVGLLLLDVRMPGVSGLDVVRYMRRVEQTQHIPVILLTGFGPDHELTSTAFGLGVADLVMKPIDPWALRTKVRYLFDSHQRHLALEHEVRELRAMVRDHAAAAPVKDHTDADEPAPRPALPHPDARVPPQRAQGAHNGELEQERT
ncbi:response regulator [Streptomyces fulvoviolaceus]|uniref:response regulator n=1 Tax=Streptomyces fulvoviolaceus TaxID=285535 RepID=UPI0004CBFC35|nr:response regulator [Streptomyces fulvoviolaceus]MCT9082355.1 response regulator [Streptomyces fulvoviolaceus]